MCNCGPEVRIQEYQNTVGVPIPPHMDSYRVNRAKAGLSGLVGIDRCILPEIQYLWSLGIRTYGSCCGHNVSPSMVNVHEEDDSKMLEMGYYRWPFQPPSMCHETFFLKSVQMAAGSPMLPVLAPQAAPAAPPASSTEGSPSSSHPPAPAGRALHTQHGSWVVSVNDCWIPGAYESEAAALLAPSLPDETLIQLQASAGQGVITLEALRATADRRDAPEP